MKMRKLKNMIIAAIILSMCGTPVVQAQEAADFTDEIQVVLDNEDTVEDVEDTISLDSVEVEIEEPEVIEPTENIPDESADVQISMDSEEMFDFTDTPEDSVFSSEPVIEEEEVEPAGDTVISAVNFNAVNFPDEVLRKILQKYDVNVDSVFSAEEIAVVTELDVSSCEITSLKGLGYFKKLTVLNCSDNKLESLDLTGYDNLVSLNCNNNAIKSLNVSGLKKLQSLKCTMNGMETLTVKGAEQLQNLQCGLNKLKKLDVSGLTNLSSLSCSANKITEFNLAGASNLTVLECVSNEITSLNVTELTKLDTLYCSLNPMKSLNLSGLMNLRRLAVGGTEECLLQELKLDKVINVEEFRIDRATLNGLNLSAMPKLKSFTAVSSSVATTTLDLSDRAVLDTFAAKITPVQGLYKTIVPHSLGWQLNLKDALNGKDSSRMTLVSWEEEGGISHGAEEMAVSGDYLIFKTDEKPVKLNYKWDTGSADGRMMEVEMQLKISSIKLPTVPLKASQIVFVKTLKQDNVRINWEPVAGASGYYVYRYNIAAKKWEKYATVQGGKQNHFIVSDMAVGDSATYSVAAFTYMDPADKTKITTGSYNKTGITVKQTFCGAYPHAITSVSSVSAGNNKISWESRQKATGFIVYRKTSTSGWRRIAIVDNAVTTYNDTTCEPGVYYYYAVKAYADTSSGNTLLSKNAAEVGVFSMPQTAVLINAKVVKTDDIQINWRAAEGADRYAVFRKTPGSSWTRIAVCGVNQLSYTDENTVLGEKYTYTVRSYGKDGEGSGWGNYNKNGLTIIQEFDTEIVEIVSVKALNPSAVLVKWNERAGASGYRVFRKTESGSWKVIGKVKNALHFTDTTCEPGSVYYYTVRAYAENNGTEVHSKYDPGKKVTIGLDTPEFTKVYVTSKDIIRVMWDEIPGAEGYLVYRKEDGGKWARAATINKQQCYYTDLKAVMGKTYEYRVRAYSVNGNKNIYSAYSAISTPIKQVFYDSPVSMSVKKVSASSVRVTWTARSRAQRYAVYRREAGGSWKRIALVGNNVTAYTDTTCKKGKTYAYLVRGYAGGVWTKNWSGIAVKM